LPERCAPRAAAGLMPKILGISCRQYAFCRRSGRSEALVPTTLRLAED